MIKTSYLHRCCRAILFSGALIAPQRLMAQEPKSLPSTPLEVVESHLAAGEFSLARQKIEALPLDQRDSARLQMIEAMSAAGMQSSAVSQLGHFNSTTSQRAAISKLQPFSDAGGSAIRGSTQDGNGRVDRGAAGGGAMADFGSLMSLIQTTIAPNNWEALGGPSTMFPYPAGIHVDPSGLVRDVELDQSDRLRSLRSSLKNSQSQTPSVGKADWTRASKLRIVSLRKLREAWLRQVADALPIDEVMQNLAGLSEVQYVIIEQDDILLAGPIGGIDPAAVPWARDRKSGKTVLGLDLLVVSADAVRRSGSFGCSIDPTAAGLAAAAKVSTQVSNRDIPVATAADELGKALGRQRVYLFNVAGDNSLAWLLVDADRHMKQLALGIHEMPPGVPNYLDVLDATVRVAPNANVPSGQLLRMWFASNSKQVRGSSDSRTFELSGLPIRLATAKEISGEMGKRIQAGDDPLGLVFATTFNENFSDIAARYPVYDRLRGAFELAAVMQLVRLQTDAKTYETLVGELAFPDLMLPGGQSVPTECDSIAVRKTIKTANQRHEIYIASGGIAVNPSETLVSKVESYPGLDSLGIDSADAPVANTRWWWDRN